MAALDVLRREKLDQRARSLGDYFRRQLLRIKTDKIKEVRGMGLLTGMELKLEAGRARPYCMAMMKSGILAKDTHEQTIRFAPPLVISKRDVDWAVKVIAKVLATTSPEEGSAAH